MSSDFCARLFALVSVFGSKSAGKYEAFFIFFEKSSSPKADGGAFEAEKKLFEKPFMGKYFSQS